MNNTIGFLVILIPLGLGVPNASAGELALRLSLPNPGFEIAADDGDTPTGWRLQANHGYTWAHEMNDRHAGDKALAIRLDGPARERTEIILVSDAFPIQPGLFHRLTGWIKMVDWPPRHDMYCRITFNLRDKEGNAFGTRDLNYMEVGDEMRWSPIEFNIPVPVQAVSAFLTVRVHTVNPVLEKWPYVLLDDLRLQAYRLPQKPSENSPQWTYHATDYAERAPAEKDPDSRSGRAQHAVVGRESVGSLISGPVISHQRAGLYRVSFRMKVSDNTRQGAACYIRAVCGGIANSHTLCGRPIFVREFTAPNQYQEFSMDFFRPALGGMQYLCSWGGMVDLWLDTITVTTLRQLSDAELVEAYLREEGEPVRPDPAGGLYLLAGLFHTLYRTEEVAQDLGTEVEQVSHMLVGGTSRLQPPFPSDPAALSGLRAVVMADVDAQALGPAGRHALRQFVRAGGTLLVLGGWVSYGQAKMDNTFIEELLPVTSPGAFDREELSPPPVLVPDHGWRASRRLPWHEKPVCLFIHRLTLKPGAKLLVTTDDKPFLVVGRFGKGKVIACAGTLLGTVSASTLPFWQWDGWPELVAKAITAAE